jgi:hypothetical protein
MIEREDGTKHAIAIAAISDMTAEICKQNSSSGSPSNCASPTAWEDASCGAS